jgi:hypothetical protein
MNDLKSFAEKVVSSIIKDNPELNCKQVAVEAFISGVTHGGMDYDVFKEALAYMSDEEDKGETPRQLVDRYWEAVSSGDGATAWDMFYEDDKENFAKIIKHAIAGGKMEGMTAKEIFILSIDQLQKMVKDEMHPTEVTYAIEETKNPFVFLCTMRVNTGTTSTSTTEKTELIPTDNGWIVEI